MLRVMADKKNPAKVEFGALLKEARTHLNLMHQDIVRILGEWNTQQVSNWERGIILPTRRRVEKLFDELPGINRDRMWELWMQEENTKIQRREASRLATLDAKKAAEKAPKPPRLGKQLEPIEPTVEQTPVQEGRRAQGRRRQAS